MTLPSIRTLYGLMALSCAGLLAAAYYFEYVMFLEPCPLCIMQRVATLFIGLVALIAWAKPAATAFGHKLVLGFGLLASAFGLAMAGRHVWIQSLPEDQVPACGPSLEYMMDALPFMDFISVLMRGNGNCAELSWSFLGMSMPTWVLIWFLGFTGLYIYQFIRKPS